MSAIQCQVEGMFTNCKATGGRYQLSHKTVNEEHDPAEVGSILLKKKRDPHNATSKSVMKTYNIPLTILSDSNDTKENIICNNDDLISSTNSISYGNTEFQIDLHQQNLNCMKVLKKENELDSLGNSPVIRFTCDVCNRSYNRLERLKAHMYKHQPKEVQDAREKMNKRKKCHPCNLCTEAFTSKKKLHHHSQTMHSVVGKGIETGEGVYECAICKGKYRSKQRLVAHMTVHKEWRACHICGKKLSYSGMRKHLKHLHGGVKSFKCEICGRCFAEKRWVLNHLTTHTGERPFVCSSCGKTFKCQASLYCHESIHTDVFPFSCNVCGKKFRTRRLCNAHIRDRRDHNLVKRYPCDICGHGFTRQHELKNHRTSHFDVRPFSCPKCNKRFKLKSYLKCHMKSQHTEII